MCMFNPVTDIDECGSSPCRNGGTCDNLIDAFLCHCDQQHTGLTCDHGETLNTPVILSIVHRYIHLNTLSIRHLLYFS